MHPTRATFFLLSPNSALPRTGPARAWVVGLVQLMGKTVGEGFAAKGALRHKEPLLCAQGALGRWLIIRFTIMQEQFPSPTSDEWKETVLWHASDPTQQMSYQNHKNRLAGLYARLNILIEKITHACRLWAARFGEEAGLSDGVRMAQRTSVCMYFKFGVCGDL